MEDAVTPGAGRDSLARRVIVAVSAARVKAMVCAVRWGLVAGRVPAVARSDTGLGRGSDSLRALSCALFRDDLAPSAYGSANIGTGSKIIAIGAGLGAGCQMAGRPLSVSR